MILAAATVRVGLLQIQTTFQTTKTRAASTVTLTLVESVRVTAMTILSAKEILFASNVTREIPFLVAVAPQARVSK